jgi:hypothetical protein
MSGLRLGFPPAIRSAHSLRSWLALGIVAGTSLCAGESKAALVQVTSRAALAGTEFIEWGDLGGPGTLVDRSFTVDTNQGTTVTGTMFAFGYLERLNQSNPDPWAGNFNNGDRLLFTNIDNNFDNPITLRFPTGFAGVGTQIQADTAGGFTGRISAYSTGDVFLGSFDVAGNSTADVGTAIFIGLRSTSASTPIVRVDFSVPAASGTKSAYAINQVDFSTQFDPPIDAVPAPLPFLGVGAGFAYSRRLKARIRASLHR